MAEISISTEQKVLVTLTPKTAAGNPAAVDGPATFNVLSGNCTIEPVSDLSAYIVSGDIAGPSVVEVSADADLGEGVVTISDTVNVEVTSPQATSLGLTLGTPEPK